jgi:hypothetical protein
MPTECSRDLFGFEVVEGRQVVAAFDGGEVTSDAGALLLGATDRAIHAQIIEAQRKISVAAKPSTVRPAWSTAHFSIRLRLSGPALKSSVAMSFRFVGMMPRSV